MDGRGVKQGVEANAAAEKMARCSYRRDIAMGAKYFRPCNCVTILIVAGPVSYVLGFFLISRLNATSIPFTGASVCRNSNK